MFITKTSFESDLRLATPVGQMWNYTLRFNKNKHTFYLMG